MIILDTNVISEPMRAAPDPNVLAWMDAQRPETLYTTVLTLAEIAYGIERMAEGRRRDELVEAAKSVFETDFRDRTLAFDQDSARQYGVIRAARMKAGMPMEPIDAQIAAIARAVGAMIATRNIGDFQACGVHLINPWEERAEPAR